MRQACSGHGDCLGQSGYCGCYSGYTGASCGRCASGYLPLRSYCVFLPGALAACSDGVRNGEEEGVDCGGPTCVQKCSDAAGNGLHSSPNHKVSGTALSARLGAVLGLALKQGRLAARLAWWYLQSDCVRSSIPHLILVSRWYSLAWLAVLADWLSWSAPSYGSLPLPLAGWDCGRNQVGETRGPWGWGGGGRAVG